MTITEVSVKMDCKADHRMAINLMKADKNIYQCDRPMVFILALKEICQGEHKGCSPDEEVLHGANGDQYPGSM